jgi:hypothetical protein
MAASSPVAVNGHGRSSMKRAIVFIQCELPTIQSFLWSLLTGIIGSLILTVFLHSIMSPELLSLIIPLIVGFNAATSGFMLIERTAGEIKREKTSAAIAGMMVALLSLLAVNTLSLKVDGFPLVPDSLAIGATFIGTLAGWSGGILAIKHRALKERAIVS